MLLKLFRSVSLLAKKEAEMPSACEHTEWKDVVAKKIPVTPKSPGVFEWQWDAVTRLHTISHCATKCRGKEKDGGKNFRHAKILEMNVWSFPLMVPSKCTLEGTRNIGMMLQHNQNVLSIQMISRNLTLCLLHRILVEGVSPLSTCLNVVETLR